MAEFRLNCDYVTKKGLGKACKASGRFEVSGVDFLNPKMACMLHIRQMCKPYRIPVCFEVLHDGNMVPVDTNGEREELVEEREELEELEERIKREVREEREAQSNIPDN